MGREGHVTGTGGYCYTCRKLETLMSKSALSLHVEFNFGDL